MEIALAGEAGRRVRVVEEFPADVPPVPVDEAQILQAFLNVVLNAVEAMPATGTLRLRLHPEADVMEVKIVDSGIGIPPAVRDRLFEPFVSGRPQGSGLGLAIVKRIVEAHGGTVRAAAAEGEGTAFTIRLPRETG